MKKIFLGLSYFIIGAVYFFLVSVPIAVAVFIFIYIAIFIKSIHNKIKSICQKIITK